MSEENYIHENYKCKNPCELNHLFKNVNFSILNMNIRSIRKNFDELCVLINNLDFSPSVIVLTETQMKQVIPYNLPEYTTISSACKHTGHDGVTVFCHNTLKNVASEFIEFKTANAIKVTFCQNNYKYHILAIYRSPSLNDFLFVKELKSFVSKLDRNNFTFSIVTGDINININDNNTNVNCKNEYLDCLSSSGHMSYINSPTRVTLSHSACLDHIFVKSHKAVNIISSILETNITDHYPTFYGHHFKNTPLNQNHENLEKVDIDYETLNSLLRSEKWENVISIENPHLALENFYKTLRDHTLKSESKIVVTNKKYKKIKPWITVGLIISIKQRDKLYREMFKYQIDCQKNNLRTMPYLKTKYLMYRNLLNRLIRNCKKKYYSIQIENAKNNTKKTWNIINEIANKKSMSSNIVNEVIINNEIITNKSTIAESFNNYFTNVVDVVLESSGINVNDAYMETSPQLDTNNDSINSIEYFSPVTLNEIEKYIDNLKPSNSKGNDGLSCDTLKKIKQHVLTPLQHIFNICLKNGQFPEQFKISTIIPIHKSGDTNKLDNYRPISLVSNLSKIFEKCIKFRVIEHLEKYKILSKNQYGFRKDLSTEDAIYELTKKIYSSIDKKKKCLAIFLDLRKAFDTVNHNLLITKINQLGFKKDTLKLLSNYLKDRTQKTKIGNNYSSESKIKNGVPQGTVLGPILFLIYINDLCNFVIPGKIVSYADDTAIIVDGNHWKETFSKATDCISLISTWLKYNKLVLNYSKTFYLPFYKTIKNKPKDNLKIRIHNTSCNREMCFMCNELTSVENIKYLGVSIDINLNWKSHINQITSKLRYLTYIFYRLKEVLNIEKLKMIYFSLVQSSIIYGIIGWGGALDTFIKPLQIIQKHIIKVIFNKNKTFSTNLLYKETKILNIRKLFILQTLKYVFKNKNNFEINENRMSKRINNIFYTPQTNTKLLQTHSSFIGPRTFNLLPLQTQMTNKMIKYVKEVKLWLHNVDIETLFL